MPEKQNQAFAKAALRHAAEARFQGQPAPPPSKNEADQERRLYELRIHQIELEMQNDELRLLQAELITARNRYFDLYNLAPVGYCTVDQKGRILETNIQTTTLLGVPQEKLIKQHFCDFVHHEDQPRYRLYLQQSQTAPQTCELRLLKPDGVPFWAQLQSATDARGTPIKRIMLSNITDHKRAADALRDDNTEHKRAEAALREVNRQLRSSTSCSLAFVRATEEQALLNEVCRILCAEAGYRLVWVGYAEADDAKTVRPVAWAGVEAGFFNTANITWADTDHGRGPTGTAIRSGTTSHTQNITTDPRMAPWRERAWERGYGSSIALPLKSESGATFGACNLYAAQPNAFTPDEVHFLEKVVENLAFVINALRTRAEHKRAEAALHVSLAEQPPTQGSPPPGEEQPPDR